MTSLLREHSPVLEKEIFEILSIKSKDIIFDGTLGTGGHAQSICNLQKDVKYIGLDLDVSALAHAEERLKDKCSDLSLVENNYKNIREVIDKLSIEKVDKIILDLGWGTHQINLGRGFSFRSEEPLIMTFSQNSSKYLFNAYDVVNTWEEDNLFSIIKNYGEERHARKIARAIVRRREDKKIGTSLELAELISSSLRWFEKRGKTHPARRTFQAIRIAVNDEVECLRDFLEVATSCLNKNGIVAIISFHSIEDRIVKHTFKDWAEKGVGKILTKKPITATETEIEGNMASRSAKLRAFKKE